MNNNLCMFLERGFVKGENLYVNLPPLFSVKVLTLSDKIRGLLRKVWYGFIKNTRA
jgi:hypothetical protein